MCKKLSVIVLLTCLTVGVQLAYAEEVYEQYSPIWKIKDVYVATVPDINNTSYDLRFDLYLPKNHNNDPKPLLLFIHGHGGTYNFPNGSRAYDFSIALANKGVAVATIDYRPGQIFSTTTLQQNLWDVKAYLRYFRAHAEDYNIDPTRFCIWSTSRGGRLGALLATTGDSGDPALEGEVGDNLGYSTALQCAVIYYPMEGVAPFNALDYIDKDDPPALIAVGGHDVVTPAPISLALYNKYVEKDGNANLFMWSPGVHGRVGLDIEAYTSEWILNKLFPPE